MDATRLGIIVGMAAVTYLIRIIPQLFFSGRLSGKWDGYLRYLAYAFIASIICTSLFFVDAQFQTHAAYPRAIALLAAVAVAFWSKHILWGLSTGVLVILGFQILG